MSDSGAAGRIRDAITLGARTGLECATVHRDDLRAVLAENETMRKQLAGLKVVWESIYSSDEYDTKAEALAAATKDRFGTAAVDEDVTWRLVGEWQPAEGGDDVQR